MSSVESRSASVVSNVETDLRLPDAAPSSMREAGNRFETLQDVQAQPEIAGREFHAAPSSTSGRDVHQASAQVARSAEPARPRHASPVPRITIQAFCESPDIAALIDRAAGDRVMARASVATHAGGINGAVAFCQQNPVPNLLIVESRAANETVLAELEGLADVCDPGTKVMVVGHSNDVSFYRELLRRGVSEYAVAPVDVVSLIASISSIYRDTSSGKLGQVFAFVGAKGGIGSSTVAHNVGWTMAQRFGSDVVLADLDLPFGTASLDFNLDVSQGVLDAIQDAGRLDEVLLDRLLVKCDDHFSILAAPATLDRPYDLDPHAFDRLLEVAQANVPFTILDVPHVWSSWALNALVAADEIVVTAAPDLANLRNAKSLIAFLKQARPNDAPPKLVLNQVGMTKRPEIKPNEFARALEMELLATIGFDAQLFGTAANNGKMIASASAKSPAAQAFGDVAAGIAGRREPAKRRKSLFDLKGLIGRTKKES